MATYSTNILKLYLDKIFGEFEKIGAKVGQGGYFTRTWYNDRTLTQGYKIHLGEVLNVLLQNEHITADNPRGLPFLRLTQSGFEYLQGGDLSITALSLNQFISTEEAQNHIFEQLWSFIGKEDEAPFYLNGSDFFNTIAPYVGLTSYSYSQYTKERIEDGKSAARIEWYRELFYKLPQDAIESFLNDISLVIVKIYNPLLRVTEEDVSDSMIEEVLSLPNVENVNHAQLDSKERKIVIFISYTWETEITPGHKKWVKSLANILVSEGFEVLFDQYQPLGTEMNHFMADAVKRADRILLICTPTFKQRSDDMQNACGFEASMISNELIKNVTSTKFLPIVRIGTPKNVMPTYLGNRNALIWHDGDDDKTNADKLIKDLKGTK